MTSTFFDKFQSIVIGTGNVLDDEEFKKAKTPTQEMLICLSSRINEVKKTNVQSDSDKFVSIPHENEQNGASENSEGKTKTVLKIFLNEYHHETIEETLGYTLKLCKTAPNVILSYSPTSKIENDKFIWAENDAAKAKSNFKLLWTKLREQKKAKKIEQLGIADMDLDTILDIFEDKNYDFTILQINIATCCMPPPCLVNFCKENEIQLLTHSDPQVLLPSCHLEEVSLSAFKVKWIVRYLESLVCRGILTKKGFIVNFQRK
ncbi:hypothetical protein PVAND_008296 [Polypedilum vanderplanki]|uniref:GCS light chain n=1 Tax=Polypedilum vanderplanki TaxID=319348 RepID=A0A9J6C9R9_POLVA|nr:hypothetical protein PVAND_008296 [Polypedilum vanderplanki]